MVKYIYAASVMHFYRGVSRDYPIVATGECYSDIEAFAQFCKLQASIQRINDFDNTSVNIIKVEVLSDGTLKPIDELLVKLPCE